MAQQFDQPTPPSQAELDDVLESFMAAVDRVEIDRQQVVDPQVDAQH